MGGLAGAVMNTVLLTVVIGTVTIALGVDLAVLAAWIRRRWRWD
jgi:hypothetical protein